MRVLQRVDSLYSNSPIRSVSPASGGVSPGSVTRGDSSRYSWPIDADALTAPVSGSSWRPVSARVSSLASEIRARPEKRLRVNSCVKSNYGQPLSNTGRPFWLGFGPYRLDDRSDEHQVGDRGCRKGDTRE